MNVVAGLGSRIVKGKQADKALILDKVGALRSQADDRHQNDLRALKQVQESWQRSWSSSERSTRILSSSSRRRGSTRPSSGVLSRSGPSASQRRSKLSLGCAASWRSRT